MFTVPHRDTSLGLRDARRVHHFVVMLCALSASLMTNKVSCSSSVPFGSEDSVGKRPVLDFRNLTNVHCSEVCIFVANALLLCGITNQVNFRYTHSPRSFGHSDYNYEVTIKRIDRESLCSWNITNVPCLHCKG